MKRLVRWFLFDTAFGDWWLWCIERLFGLEISPVNDEKFVLDRGPVVTIVKW